MSRNGRSLLGLAVGLLVLAADQASKYWVLEVLNLPAQRRVPVFPGFDLTMVRNYGITFGLLSSDSAWSGVVLAAVALAVVVALAVWLRRAEHALVAVALGAVAGGAVGNIIDRMRLGWVVDFLDFTSLLPGLWRWVFNVGDSAIVCGVAMLVLDGMRRPDTTRLAGSAGDK
jgi:lipoprotein signal peptidase